MDYEAFEELKMYLFQLTKAIEKLAYELKDKDSCPNSFDFFDKRCMSCPYGDVYQRDED